MRFGIREEQMQKTVHTVRAQGADA